MYKYTCAEGLQKGLLDQRLKYTRILLLLRYFCLSFQFRCVSVAMRSCCATNDKRKQQKIIINRKKQQLRSPQAIELYKKTIK